MSTREETPAVAAKLITVAPTKPRNSHETRATPQAAQTEGTRDSFRRFAQRVSCIMGTPAAFLTALVVIVFWAVSGPFFRFSDTWQLIINTSTTIITFLMVFLIQSTQNRDASALHLKLDELIRATRSARNDLVALEQMSDAELRDLERQFEELRNSAREIRDRKTGTTNA